MLSHINVYLVEIQKKFKTGQAREHAYRPALESLVESLNPSINAVNDPKQQKVGAPDFVLLQNKIPIGYIEAKDITVDLDKELKTKNQVNRYKASLNNLCFTNYLEFRFYFNGEETERIEVARLVDNKIEIIDKNLEFLESVLKNFTLQKSVTISNPKDLASLMAQKAKMLKNTIYLSLEDKDIEDGPVEKQFEIFKQMLIHDLSHEQFADIYAQTIVYGMFAARYRDKTLDTFSRDEANNLLPKSNPFLRNFFQTIAGYNIDERIVWIVDDLADLFNHVDVRKLLQDFGKETKRDDVIVHFYETFLAKYDSKLRKARGVYYTPEPVVDFMVRAVDDILKSEFDINDGLSDTSMIDVLKEDHGKKKRVKVSEHRVQILDPATGTGTFLDHIIKHIYNSKFKGQEGVWQSYVDEHLLPRLHGFEILMASYAMAHMKLDITLAETGYDSDKGKGKRIGVYLTNSLEEPEALQRDLFSQWLSDESLAANEVKKEKPIMVVIGNPPYSGHSSNTGDYARSLVDKYKFEPGGKEKLKERNPKWLNDDYVKFISYGEELIKKNGEGVLAFINNHGWLDNPTFRGMRWQLMQTFDQIYVIDLHGNTKKKEKTPDGGSDENVFDIQQGVSINIFIKKRNSKNVPSKVNQFDLYGRRQFKYDFLDNGDFYKVDWNRIEPRKPFLSIVDKDWKVFDEYQKGFVISELFPVNSVGIVTANDKVLIGDNGKAVCGKVEEFYKISSENKYVQRINYRPFDIRSIYYDTNLIERARENVMQHLILKQNVGLILNRQVKTEHLFHHWVSKQIVDLHILETANASANYFPLYLYPEEDAQSSLENASRRPNLDLELVDVIAKKLGLEFIPDHQSSPKATTDK